MLDTQNQFKKGYRKQAKCLFLLRRWVNTKLRRNAQSYALRFSGRAAAQRDEPSNVVKSSLHVKLVETMFHCCHRNKLSLTWF